jgi:hypothetical protein
VVGGLVTWRGDPIAATAGLWPIDGIGEPIVTSTVGSDGRLQLPPAPIGPWRLRVDAADGARFETTVELTLPGPITVDVPVPEGTRLLGRVVGTLAGPTTIVCTHASGRQQTSFVRADGSYEVPHLFPGRWRIHALPREGDWQQRSLWFLVQLLDEPGLVVGSVQELHHDVAPATSLFGSVHGAVGMHQAGSTVELVPADATQERVPAALRSTRVAADGLFRFAPVLPGTWRARWTPVGLPPREVTLVAAAGSETICAFPE